MRIASPAVPFYIFAAERCLSGVYLSEHMWVCWSCLCWGLSSRGSDGDTVLQVRGFPPYWSRRKWQQGCWGEDGSQCLCCSLQFLNLWPMFLCIASPGGRSLLSGCQDKSLGCSICIVMDRCEELLNSRMHEGQDADKVYSVRSLFFGTEGREECRKGLPRARQWALAGGGQEAWMSPSVYIGRLGQNKEISHAFFWLIFKHKKYCPRPQARVGYSNGAAWSMQ